MLTERRSGDAAGSAFSHAEGLMLRLLAALFLAAALAACATPQPACRRPATDGDIVYVVAHGWHVELGLTADELHGPLGVFRGIFPGAKAFMFGYGKRTFMTAPPDSISEYLLGPVPGPAVIQVTGLTILPSEAYLPGETIELALPPGGARRLSDFIWSDLDKDHAGGPRLLAPGNYPGGLFYFARSGYSLLHTCNTWAADGLATAGLPISGDGVVLSHQVTARAETVLAGQCAVALPQTAAR